MRCACAPSVCNSGDPALPSGRALSRPYDRRPLRLGDGPTAALHPLVDRHPARNSQRSLSLHRRRYSDHNPHTGHSMGARVALSLARLWLAHNLHGHRPWCRLHKSQRMVQYPNPAQLGLYRGNAGPSLDRHWTHAVTAVGGRPRPVFCRHCLPGRAPSPPETVMRKGAFTFEHPCAMRESWTFQNPSEDRPYSEATPAFALPDRALVARACERQPPYSASSRRRSRPALPRRALAPRREKLIASSASARQGTCMLL
jgi:hypothetical protein